jgi:hypothetical protein
MAETLKEILNSLRDKARGEPICKVSEGEMQYFGALKAAYEANHLITLDSLTPAQKHADELVEAINFYANGVNWLMHGPCDPNSGNFVGEKFANDLLATIKGDE